MKKVITISWQIPTILGILLIFSTVTAHQQVVVIPLGGKKSTSPTENTFTNSVGMTFNLIPAGSFTMGSPDSEPGGPYPDEQPQHQGTITKSFYIQTTEVAQKQWQDIIGNNPAVSNTGDEYPLEYVNWFEAAYFANALSSAEGRSACYTLTGCSPIPGNDMECTDVAINSGCTGYRLPTEAEWEYASRATTTTAWPYAESYDVSVDPGQVTGSGFNSNLDAMGWYAFNMTTQYASGTKPVARKQANKWGLYDMQGNVMEWCQDWFAVLPDGDAIDPMGPGNGSNRVLRGGCWLYPAICAGFACRDKHPPLYANMEVGFRVVLAPILGSIMDSADTKR